jgi:hypothetical protein
LKTALKNQELESSEKHTIETDNDCSKNTNNDNSEYRVVVNNFQCLDSNKKWILSTRKLVNNELFIFGSQYDINDYPSKTLIIDPYDENYLKYQTFTSEELNEIRNFRKKDMPVLSQD